MTRGNALDLLRSAAGRLDVFHPRGGARRSAISREIASGLAGLSTLRISAKDLRRFVREIRLSGLQEHLWLAEEQFRESVRGSTDRGNPYEVGRIGDRGAIAIYAVIRALRPQVAVETGVCNGFSAAFALLALHMNGTGKLYSIDLPEVAGGAYEVGAFWEGKKGAVIPPGRQPGWVIPEEMRGPWELIIGRSQEVLPPLLSRLGEIDYFFHDSEHSYECMTFEFGHAYAALRPGGVLGSDDVDWNDAFADFARDQRRMPSLVGKMGFIQK